MGVEIAVDAAEAVDAADMEEEAAVIDTTITVTAPIITVIMMAGPMPTLAAATATSTNRTQAVERGKLSSPCSPLLQMRAR